MKRIFMVMLVVVMTVGALVGCSTTVAQRYKVSDNAEKMMLIDTYNLKYDEEAEQWTRLNKKLTKTDDSDILYHLERFYDWYWKDENGAIESMKVAVNFGLLESEFDLGTYLTENEFRDVGEKELDIVLLKLSDYTWYEMVEKLGMSKKMIENLEDMEGLEIMWEYLKVLSFADDFLQ